MYESGVEGKTRALRRLQQPSPGLERSMMYVHEVEGDRATLLIGAR